MGRSLLGLVAATLALAGAPAYAAELELSIGGGKVTIIARDASLQEILAEWGRIGNTTIVDADELEDERVNLELVDVPETQALRTLLRAAAGYMAAPRATADLSASRFDRILIMATSKPSVRVAPSPSASRGSVPTVRSGSGQRLGVVPRAPQGRAPFSVSPAQQEQLDQLQALLQAPDDEDDEEEPEPADLGPVFGNQPTSRPGQAMGTGDGRQPDGLPTGVFGATDTSDAPATIIPD